MQRWRGFWWPFLSLLRPNIIISQEFGVLEFLELGSNGELSETACKLGSAMDDGERVPCRSIIRIEAGPLS